MTEVHDYQIIWFPGIYHGSDSAEYTQLVGDTTLEEIIPLVQKRAEHDGEYCIAHGLVGLHNENEPLMRRMMEFVSSVKNITQCYEYICIKEKSERTRTVDFMCRDLANASKTLGIGSKLGLSKN